MKPLDLVDLVSPSGGTARVRRGSALERRLRAKGWSTIRSSPPAGPPAKLSETARQARAELSLLSPEEWILDWAEVLCAALDEHEELRQKMVEDQKVLAEFASAALAGLKEISAALARWARARQHRAAGAKEGEILAETAGRIVTELGRRAGALITAFGDRGAGRLFTGDPAARAAASEILAQLGREVGEGDAGDRLRASLAKTRAFLGGSNIPGGEDDGEPS